MAPSTYDTYDTYDDQSIEWMKFEKAPNGSQIRKVDRAQPWGQGWAHTRVKEEVEIRDGQAINT